jgi:hypothetical protein
MSRLCHPVTQGMQGVRDVQHRTEDVGKKIQAEVVRISHSKGQQPCEQLKGLSSSEAEQLPEDRLRLTISIISFKCASILKATALLANSESTAISSQFLKTRRIATKLRTQWDIILARTVRYLQILPKSTISSDSLSKQESYLVVYINFSDKLKEAPTTSMLSFGND